MERGRGIRVRPRASARVVACARDGKGSGRQTPSCHAWHPIVRVATVAIAGLAGRAGWAAGVATATGRRAGAAAAGPPAGLFPSVALFPEPRANQAARASSRA
eukprot:scaffold18252_cov45-Isochrysis_galbana.AAC.1